MAMRRFVYQSSDLAETIATLANHGQRNKYTSDLIGINSRLDALQAAILHVKLHHLDAFIEARQEVADFYDAALSGCANLTIPFRCLTQRMFSINTP